MGLFFFFYSFPVFFFFFFFVFDRHLYGSTSLLFECCGSPHLGLYSAIYTFESTG